MISCLSSILVGLLALGVGGKEPPQEAIRLISFNIRYDNSRDGLHAWGYRRHRVAGILRSYRADIFGLQEALPQQVAEIERRFPGFGSIGVGRDRGNRGERCVIFFDKSRFRPMEGATFWLSPDPDRPGPAWGARLSRICTWGEFEDRHSRKSFFVFNTHFDHQSAKARAMSAELLVRKIDEISAGAPAFLLGDFNCQPGSAPYQSLIEGTIAGESHPQKALRDARDFAEEPPSGPPGTWSGFGTDDGHGRRIDFIFTRGDVQVRHYGVIPHSWEDRPASDHRPVLAEVIPHRPSRRLHLPLDRGWRFMAMAEKEGEGLGFGGSDVDDSQWPLLDAGGPWESQGQDVDGVAWCRKWVTIPEEWQGKGVHFESEGIADEFTLYIGGKKLLSLGKKGESYWNRHVAIPIPEDLLKCGEKNLIVLRIDDHGGFGGLTGLPLRLTVAEVATTQQGGN